MLVQCSDTLTTFPRLIITQRLLGSSVSGLPSRIQNLGHKKERLRSLWVGPNTGIQLIVAVVVVVVSMGQISVKLGRQDASTYLLVPA